MERHLIDTENGFKATIISLMTTLLINKYIAVLFIRINDCT
jgi:hypothetical protein